MKTGRGLLNPPLLQVNLSELLFFWLVSAIDVLHADLFVWHGPSHVPTVRTLSNWSDRVQEPESRRSKAVVLTSSKVESAIL